MKTLVTWDPFQDLNTFSNRLQTLFGGSDAANGGNESKRGQWAPLVDISETDKEYLVKAELPEVEKENVKVTVENDVLVISGDRKFESEEKDRKHHRIERSYGSFLRSFSLPDDADGTKVSAEFKNGVLRVHLPKSEAAKPKQIEIKVS